RLVDRHVGLALGVGVDRLDLVALDAAPLREVIDHDLGAESVQVRPTAGERPAVIEDDADLELLGLGEGLGGERGARDADDYEEHTQDHGSIPGGKRAGQDDVPGITRKPCALVKSRRPGYGRSLAEGAIL